ncbi:glycosyltransferase family 4 protein [Listeria ilorinensis]|uniref:glycosyltransferase family 4 protein n=1 Tax=Listeria ilorinensis TaxID=2867439 RepID=UPI001EF522D1|nr:glycosyltransferase family 4 protein [Listeria ilorinensis]
MKKILLISQNFYPEIGSAANRMKQLFLLFKEKFDVTMYTAIPHYPNRGIYEQENLEDEGIEAEAVHRIKTRVNQYETNMFFRFLLYLETFCRFLFKIIRTKEHYDVVYVSSPPISIALVGLFAKKKLKARLIIDIRDLWPESFKGVGKCNSRFFLFFAYRLEKTIYRHADEIIINSEGYVTYITDRGGSPDKVTFVPNSLTMEELTFGSTKNQGMNRPATVIYTGNVGLAQELGSFIRMAAFFQSNPHVRFKIIGYGINFQKLIDTVEESHLTNVIIQSSDTRKQVLKELAEADIAFIGLSSHEVFERVIPGKVIDYMGMGLPIIGIASGYCKDIINNSRTGFIYEQHEEDKLYQHLRMLLENHMLWDHFHRNALRYAKDHYYWSENFKRIEKIITTFE